VDEADVAHEWQVRAVLAIRDRNFEDLEYLRSPSPSFENIRPAVLENDPNRSPFAHAIDLQEKIGEMDLIGVCRIDGRDAVLEERKIRIGISVYGYLKRMGAIVCVQDQKGMISFEESIGHLRYYMGIRG
jgi:hypothetical protein